MNKKGLFSIILLLTLVFNLTGLKAQEVLDVYPKQHMSDRKAVPYQYLREADVMWSKTIWRVIELKEKMNFPLYYPEEPIGNRMNLISLLIWGIANQGLTAYGPSSTDEFATVMTMKDIEDKFDAGVIETVVEDIDNPGTFIKKMVEKPIDYREVKQIRIKELWFFDKQRSVMEVRVIGICPVRIFEKNVTTEDPDAEEGSTTMGRKPLFWIYFPEARKLLANHMVFNPENDAEAVSFDDIFFKRMFSSYIIQESNAYNNRPVSEYTLGLESLLEAERIKESIFNYEQDLWEY
jgi:gliding motility associated protien GldN